MKNFNKLEIVAAFKISERVVQKLTGIHGYVRGITIRQNNSVAYEVLLATNELIPLQEEELCTIDEFKVLKNLDSDYYDPIN